MNTATTMETAAVIQSEAAAAVSRHAITVHHLCAVLSEQDTLSEAAIAVGHAIRALADHVQDVCITATWSEDDWSDVWSRATSIKTLAGLLREQSAGHMAGLALADAIEQLAEHIIASAGDYAP